MRTGIAFGEEDAVQPCESRADDVHLGADSSHLWINTRDKRRCKRAELKDGKAGRAQKEHSRKRWLFHISFSFGSRRDYRFPPPAPPAPLPAPPAPPRRPAPPAPPAPPA